MTRNRKFGVGAALLVGAIGYLVFAGVQQSSVYYFKLDEFLPRKEDLAGQNVRVAGRVAAGSIRKQVSARGTELNFVLGNFTEGDAAAQNAGLRVEFFGVQPDMFADGRDVIVEGKYADGILHAQTVMTSCPSKYEAESDGAAKSNPSAS